MSSRFEAPALMSVDAVIAAYDGIMPKVESILQERGISARLPEPAQPEGLDEYLVFAENNDPVLPDDLTLLDPVSIGKLFTFFTSWANYLQGMTTEAEVARDVIKAKMQTIEKALLVTFQAQDETLSDRRAAAKVRLDMRYVNSEAAYMEAYALTKTLGTRYEQFKRSEKVISRELTRRQQELEANAQGGQRKAFTPSWRGNGQFS